MNGITFYFGWEASLMQWLQSHMGTLAAKAAAAATVLGEELCLIAVLGLLYWCIDKKFAVFVGTNITLGLVANPMLKNTVLRRRPYFDLEGIQCLKPVHSGDIYDISLQGYSFPSGHAMNSALVYGSLQMYRKRKILIAGAFILPLLVGFSRVLLGVHYPTDVLAGWACGAAIVFGMSYLQRKIKRKGILRLVIFLVSYTGILYCRTADYYTALGVMGGMFLALPFEEKYVQFSMTSDPAFASLRVLGGLVLYFVLNSLLKLPFDAKWLAQPELLPFLVRAVRYCIIGFVLLGVYPMAFRYEIFFPRRWR